MPRRAESPDQFSLFPDPVSIEVLDPRQAIGPQTAVEQLVHVRIGAGALHRVFHDRHGWYCEEHGPRCRAVPLARGHAA
jgi:hypothetical protein